VGGAEVAVRDLRYQLLTACAGAVSEARRKGYSRAVMLVHEFVTSETQPGNHKRNSSDLSAFVYRLSGGGTTEVADDRLVGPFIVPGAAEVELFIGKVVRRLGTSGPQSDAWRGLAVNDPILSAEKRCQGCKRGPRTRRVRGGSKRRNGMGVSVVTGANRGIGLELARQLNARGAIVVAVCRKSSPELDALGVRVECEIDVTEPAALVEARRTPRTRRH
jgi:hypothetical protein